MDDHVAGGGEGVSGDGGEGDEEDAAGSGGGEEDRRGSAGHRQRLHFRVGRASEYVLGKSGLGIRYKVVLGNEIPMAIRRLGEGGDQRYKEPEG